MHTIMNVWEELAKPIFALAPMEDVTDSVFRRVVRQAAPADIYFTEFTSADGFCSPGKKAVSKRLRMAGADEPRPLIAQIWGLKPENYHTMAAALVEMGFDGIDINMGCPEKSVIRNGACSALIENRPLAAEIIAAAKDGAAGRIPVSVKTRIGFKKIDTESWISFLLQQGLAALTVHGRTQKEMSAVPAHWDEIAKAVQIRDALAPQTVILGNGDVRDRAHGEMLIAESGVDGVMIGRGVFADIFAFQKTKQPHTPQEHLALLAQHIQLHHAYWGDAKPYDPLKKYFKIYVRDYAGAAELRSQLMQTASHEEALHIIASALTE